MALTDKYVYEYVITSLGGEDVGVELTEKDLDVSLKEAMRKYSRRNPLQNRESVTALTKTINAFELPVGTYNVTDVQIQNSLQTFEALSSQEFNIFNPFYQMIGGGGGLGGVGNAEEYQLTLMWRKMTQRVYSLEPDYWIDWDRQFDESTPEEGDLAPHKLYVFNPTGVPQRVSYVAVSVRPLSMVEPNDEDWVLDYALAHAKGILGRKRGKFRTIPSAGQPLELDGASLIEESIAEKEKLEQELRDRTGFEYPIWG